MVVLHNVGVQIEKLDQQLIDLIEQRIALMQEAAEDDPEILGSEYDAEILAHWLGEADHKGLDEVGLERICKAVIAICRKMGSD